MYNSKYSVSLATTNCKYAQQCAFDSVDLMTDMNQCMIMQGWPTGPVAPEAGLGHQASKDLGPSLEAAQADGDI